jgi:lipid A ethanolaminephosphotransferase
MLLWLSEDYQQRYGVIISACKKAQQKHFSQDNLFSTLLGLQGSVRRIPGADDILTPVEESRNENSGH